jgi:hypothetical protein
MPLGYGYLTRHLHTGRPTLGEAVQTTNRRVLVPENEEKHGSVPKLHTCSGLDSHNEQKHWHSKCHYRRNSGSTSAGANNPTRRGGPRSNRRLTGGSPSPAPAAATTTPAPGGQTTTARASGRMLLQSCPRPRRCSRGEDKYKEPEARSADGGGDPVGNRDFSSRLHLDTDDRGRQPSGRSPLRSSRTSGAPTSARRRRTGAKAGPPQNTNAALAARDILGGPPVHTARQPPSGRRGTGSQADEPNALRLTTPAVDQPRVVEVRPARRASERPLPRTPKERPTHKPAREVELRLSLASTRARMTNILEAEGGTKIAARLASPHPGAGGHRLG